MATASIPNSFTNNTNADANLVNANFSYLSSWLNTNVIQPNAANFSVFPTLPSSAPTSDYQAVHKNYVDLFMPAGVITQYVGTAAPAGWRLCDGALYNAADATYARLWAAVGTTYGGSGINSFAVPDMKGRVPVGYGAGAGLTARALNDKAGFETHTLTAAQSGLRGHSHGITDPTHLHDTNRNLNAVNVPLGAGSPWIGIAGGNWNTSYSATGVTVNQSETLDASSAHNNMQPFIVVSYIIKL